MNGGSKVCRVESLEMRMFLSASPITSIGWNADVSAFYQAGATPLGDSAPVGTSYMLFDQWEGSWSDAEKSPTNDDDDDMCWAAACANALAWTGWGLVDGMTNSDEMFQYYLAHFIDTGGWMEYGWQWWFDGTHPWPYVDVPGGGFYPEENFNSYFHSTGGDGQRAETVQAIYDYLHAGYGITLGIFAPGSGHAISVWGVDYNPDDPSEIYGIWVTDSDDAKHLINPPDQLRYYQVAYQVSSDPAIGGAWFLQDYYGSDEWYIEVVQALESTALTPRQQQIEGTIWNDANGDGIPGLLESPIEGQTVYVDWNNNGVFDNPVFTQNVAVPLLDPGMVTSTLLVQGMSTISDVNVQLNINHTWDADLSVWVISPTGTRVELFSGIGSWWDNFTDTLLDDEAGTSIGEGSAPFTGSFRPFGLLSAFDGQNPNGLWTLEITDTMGQDTGTLNNWSLIFGEAEPCAQTDANGHYGFSDLESGTYHVRVDLPDGWACTNAADGHRIVAVQEDSNVAGVDFGLTDNLAPSATDLGAVDYLVLADLNPSGGALWYRLQTTRDARLTVATVDLWQNVVLELYDANYVKLATSSVSGGAQRIDRLANTQDVFYLKVIGSAGNVDLKIANLLARDGASVTVYGSSGDDRFEFTAGAPHQLTINGIGYAFNALNVNSVTFQGSGGVDWAMLVGTGDLDTAEMHPNSATLTGTGYAAYVTGTRDITINSGGGAADIVRLYDSLGSDTFHATPTYGDLVGAVFFCRAEGFAYLHGFASGGVDTAYLYGSDGNDTFEGKPTIARLYGSGYYHRVKDFENVHAFGGAGDVAHLYDSPGDDLFESRLGWARISGNGSIQRAVGFQNSYAHGGSGGADRARLYDSAGDDLFAASPALSSFSGSGYTVLVHSFADVRAFSTLGGVDRATLTDSAGDDTFWASPTKAYLAGAGFYNEVNGFRRVRADSIAGGTDLAYLYDSADNDTLLAGPTYARLFGENFNNVAMTFRYTHAFASTGMDAATLLDSAGDDIFQATEGWSRMYGENYFNRAKGFDTVSGIGKYGGNDKAYLFDSSASDHLDVNGRQAVLSYAASQVLVSEFPWVRASSQSGGNDTRRLQAVDVILQYEGTWTDVDA